MGVACGTSFDAVEDSLGEVVDEIGIEVGGIDMQVHTSSRLTTWFDNTHNMTQVPEVFVADKSIDIDGSIVLTSKTYIQHEVAE